MKTHLRFIILTTAISLNLAAASPNLVYILADDLGWTDTGTYGSQYYETPSIDKLASQGMKLTRYHNCQNCAPTRAALMSGQYAPRTGTYTVGNIDRFNWRSRSLRPVDNVTVLPKEKITIAETLNAAGYATAMFGKWHLGNSPEAHPSKRGFDEAIESSGKHFKFKTNPPVEHAEDDYLADWLTDHAVDFIRRHKDEPFFLYLPHFGVHSPYQAKEELIEKFKDKPPVGGHANPVYAAMIKSVDESVGRIMALLDELGLAENTVLIFSSDNGGVGGYHREGINGKDTTDNSPLRCGKGSLYEGGTRVPFVVRWPGKIPAGSTSDVASIHVDVYPTLLDLAGVQPPKGYILDGESLAPVFFNPTAQLKREAIFQHFPGYLGSGGNTWRTTPVGVIEIGDWKLMQYFEDMHLELYNLRDDIGERNNLAQAMPEKAQELYGKMLAWRAAINAPMPTPYTGEDPKKVKSSGKKKG